MAKNINGFNFSPEYLEAVMALNAVDRDKVLYAILNYGLYNTEPDLTGALKAIFMLIKVQINNDKNKRKRGGQNGNANAIKNEKETTEDVIILNVDNSTKNEGKTNKTNTFVDKTNKTNTFVDKTNKTNTFLKLSTKERNTPTTLKKENYLRDNNNIYKNSARTPEDLIMQFKKLEADKGQENFVDLIIKGKHQAKCYEVLNYLCYVGNLGKSITLNGTLVKSDAFNALLDKMTMTDLSMLVNMLLMRTDEHIDNLPIYTASIYYARKSNAVQNSNIATGDTCA